MKDPNAEENPAGQIEPFAQHQKEAEGHQQSYNKHDPAFRGTAHSISGDVTFKVVLIQGGPDEPVVEFLGTFGKSEQRQQQKRESRHQGQHRTDRPEEQSQDAE